MSHGSGSELSWLCGKEDSSWLWEGLLGWKHHVGQLTLCRSCGNTGLATAKRAEGAEWGWLEFLNRLRELVFKGNFWMTLLEF